jgi:hypothetical protein
VTTPGELLSGTTAWARRVRSPLREFLRTETGGAAVLLAAAVAALLWVNADASSYDELWETVLAIDVDGEGVELTLREWVNSGLMTFFFFVLGLEARREFDLGDFRERRRFVLPMLSSICGMGVAVGIYLAVNLGSSAAEGWGTSTKKKNVISPLFSHSRSVSSTPSPSRSIASKVSHSSWYEEASTFTHTSAATAAASSTAAPPLSVRRNSRSGLWTRRADAVCPDKSSPGVVTIGGFRSVLPPHAHGAGGTHALGGHPAAGECRGLGGL